MLKEVRPAVVLVVLMTLLLGLAYPLGMTVAASLLFPWQARGSLVVRDGEIIGSALIGQNFTSAKYFHGRPSATTTTDARGNTVSAPYNAANSGPSNLGPTSKALMQRIRTDAAKLKAENSDPIPVDLVTTSGSGLDPDITPAAAYFQVPRVARARGFAEARVRDLVTGHIEGRWLGVFGESHLNVLALNLALDEMSTKVP